MENIPFRNGVTRRARVAPLRERPVSCIRVDSANLSSNTSWALRFIDITLDKLTNNPSDPSLQTSEQVAGRIIEKLPRVQYITLTSTFRPDARGFSYPARNFEPIARALISRTRLCSVDLVGPCLGGWTCSIDALRAAGRYLRTIHLGMCSPRDVAFVRTLCSEASILETLDLSGTMRLDSDQVNDIIRALPKPEELKTLRVSLSEQNHQNAWWQEEFLESLTGLEELMISNVPRWSHTNHTNDPPVFANPEWTEYFQKTPEVAVVPQTNRVRAGQLCFR